MKNSRNKLSLMQVVSMFADETKAEIWLEKAIWGKEKCCPRCKSAKINPRPSRKPMPYHCASCRKYFSIRTNTVMQESKLPLQKWAIAIYLMATNLKGISSTHLANELGIRQASAWHLLHRIRTAFDVSNMQFDGVVEVDETFIGGKASNMSKLKRSTMKDQAYQKSIVIGLKERDSNKVIAQTIPTTGARAIQPVIRANVEPYSIIVSDENRAYKGLRKDYHHWSINHSAWEYVRGMAHTNGIESFWALLKRGYMGIYHYMSAKHLDLYVGEFAGRHNIRPQDTTQQMAGIAKGMAGKCLPYKELIA